MDGCKEKIRNLEDVTLRRRQLMSTASLVDPVQTTIPVVRTKRTLSV